MPLTVMLLLPLDVSLPVTYPLTVWLPLPLTVMSPFVVPNACAWASNAAVSRVGNVTGAAPVLVVPVTTPPVIEPTAPAEPLMVEPPVMLMLVLEKISPAPGLGDELVVTLPLVLITPLARIAYAPITGGEPESITPVTVCKTYVPP